MTFPILPSPHNQSFSFSVKLHKLHATLIERNKYWPLIKYSAVRMFESAIKCCDGDSNRIMCRPLHWAVTHSTDTVHISKTLTSVDLWNLQNNIKKFNPSLDKTDWRQLPVASNRRLKTSDWLLKGFLRTPTFSTVTPFPWLCRRQVSEKRPACCEVE